MNKFVPRRNHSWTWAFLDSSWWLSLSLSSRDLVSRKAQYAIVPVEHHEYRLLPGLVVVADLEKKSGYQAD